MTECAVCKATGERFKLNSSFREEINNCSWSRCSNPLLQKAYNEHGRSGFYGDVYVPVVKRMLGKYSEDGDLLGTYADAAAAAKDLGKKSSKHLEKEVKGDGKAYGFVWKFVDVED